MNHFQVHISSILLAKEVKFKMTTSSGNGGQNVNRVATKATLFFKVENSDLLSESQKEIILDKLRNRISKEGYLIIVNQASRSAFTNQKNALALLLTLLQNALMPKKVRKKRKVPKQVKEKRLENKKRISAKKALRKTVKGY